MRKKKKIFIVSNVLTIFCENHFKKMEIEKSIGNSGYPFQKEKLLIET